MRQREALPITRPIRADHQHRMFIDATRKAVEPTVADCHLHRAHTVRLYNVGEIRNRPIAERPRIALDVPPSIWNSPQPLARMGCGRVLRNWTMSQVRGGESVTSLVAISSGAELKYRNDILRCLGLSTGSRIQFRYRSRHIDDSLRGRLPDLVQKSSRVLVVYLDRRDPALGTQLVPCRWATLVATEEVRGFLTLQFELDGYPVYQTSAIADHSLRQVFRDLPTWNNDELPKVDGFTSPSAAVYASAWPSGDQRGEP